MDGWSLLKSSFETLFGGSEGTLFWDMKAVITPKLIKIEFCSLYVFGQFFSKESNDVILFEIQELFFFKKKLRGGGLTQKKNFYTFYLQFDLMKF